MIDVSAAAVVTAWERAGSAVLGERMRTLLALDDQARGVEEWTLGRCQVALGHVVRALSGERIEATARCAFCGVVLEFETTVTAAFGRRATDEPALPPLCVDGYELRTRPLQLRDLLGLPPSLESAQQTLLRRCVLAARHRGADVDPGQLPLAVEAAVSVQLERADGRAETFVALVCEVCGTANRILLDAAILAWEAVEALAREVFADIHVLASAYGWSEAEILALAPARRRRYRGLVER